MLPRAFLKRKAFFQARQKARARPRGAMEHAEKGSSELNSTLVTTEKHGELKAVQGCKGT